MEYMEYCIGRSLMVRCLCSYYTEHVRGFWGKLLRVIRCNRTYGPDVAE